MLHVLFIIIIIIIINNLKPFFLQFELLSLELICFLAAETHS